MVLARPLTKALVHRRLVQCRRANQAESVAELSQMVRGDGTQDFPGLGPTELDQDVAGCAGEPWKIRPGRARSFRGGGQGECDEPRAERCLERLAAGELHDGS